MVAAVSKGEEDEDEDGTESEDEEVDIANDISHYIITSHDENEIFFSSRHGKNNC